MRKLARACLLAAIIAQAAAESTSVSSTSLERRAIQHWEEAVYAAAESALKAIVTKSGAQLSLREVPLETLQVYVGRRHHIGLSIDGLQYEVVLGGEQDLSRRAAELSLPAAAASQAAGGSSRGGGGEGGDSYRSRQDATGLALSHWQSQQGGSSAGLSLPEVTLSGPLELVLPQLGPVQFFTPNAADVGPVRRIQVGAGVTVRVAGLKSIALRRPLELPPLPMGYLTEVYAHARLGQPEQGFEQSPGLHYLANHLKQLALNSSFALLSFEVQAANADSGLVVSSSGQTLLEPPPKLKVKRTRDGAVELTLRQGQVTTAEAGAELNLALLNHQWAWPLPHVDLGALVPYEALLRSILAAHPFDLNKVNQKGISIQLTKSEIKGVRLMAFEAHVRSTVSLPAAAGGEGQAGEEGEEAQQQEQSQLHVFDVVVQVVENEEVSGAAKGGTAKGPKSFSYKPIAVTLRQTFGNTMTMSKEALAIAMAGGQNITIPLEALPGSGYDEMDAGLARHAL